MSEQPTSTTTSCLPNKRGLAPWAPPVNERRSQLKILNSLTRKKEHFVPHEGNKVNWYICGPTVYDAAHMGHARSYISFDILRRVLQNYFGYDVVFVMNITDIDDKIIKRARQRFLMDNYLKNDLTIQKVIDDVLDAMVPFRQRYDNETNAEKKIMLESLLAKVERCVNELEQSLSARNQSDQVEKCKERLLDLARDVLADWLDGRFGASVLDANIFAQLARQFEADFHGDMARLNVASPDVLTRVSEYVPEIVTFIEKIIENGYAYEANGSVYFDTVAFDRAPNHYYAKLVPEAYDDDTQMTNAMREAEGELSDAKTQDKHSCNDFALWKASKAGEPSWASPWGAGRPGWHIECSVMATAVCGPVLDIHGGGFDLKFPHHDNELAQSEAYYKKEQWVNYFLHAGMLRIAGLKMSKSLKNFITIKDALKQYTARQLRLLFLLQTWSDTLDYSPSTMEGALKFEKMCNEFFLAAKFYVRERFDKAQSSTFTKFEQEELDLNAKFSEQRQRIHDCLCDSVDTRGTMEAVRELISAANVYINRKNAQRSTPNVVLVRNIALYVTRLMRTFGVVTTSSSGGSNDDEEIGFGADLYGVNNGETENGPSQNIQDREDLLMPYVKALADFREKVRTIAVDSKMASILDECDRLRNEVLPQLGVRLEDRENHTMVKFCDPEELLREKRQEADQREKLRAEKERKRQEQALREQQRRLPADQLFQLGVDHAGKYGQYDQEGIPTHDKSGAELSKGTRKKLEKMHALHKQKLNENEPVNKASGGENLAPNGHVPNGKS